MMNATNFLTPYVDALIGAAYNVRQFLEGAGLISSLSCPPTVAQELGMAICRPPIPVSSIFGALALFCLFLIGVVLLASYVLNRKKGVLFAILVIALPGLLSVGGLLPPINLVPHTYYIGDAEALGRASGFAVLLFIALIAGWVFIIISYDVFSLNGNFKNFYDHIWYGAIILTGTFFVYDVGSNKTRVELAQQNATSQRASAYLSSQAKDYFEHCIRSGIQNSISCQWAAEVQQTLGDFANYGSTLFVSFGPRNDLEIYFPNFSSGTLEQSLEIREQIRSYNNAVCPVEHISSSGRQSLPVSQVCQRPPVSFCSAFPSPPSGFVDRHIGGRTLSFASECIVPMLVQSRLTQERLGLEVERSKDDLRSRWLTFLALSFIAGGKIANATSKIASLDEREGDQRQRLWKLAIWIIQWLIKFARRLVALIVHFIKVRVMNRFVK